MHHCFNIVIDFFNLEREFGGMLQEIAKYQNPIYALFGRKKKTIMTFTSLSEIFCNKYK